MDSRSSTLHSRPTVSVIVPAYNAGQHLGAALRSALAQSAPPAEIIVVDDGSTDDTGAVATAFGPPVRVVRQDNAGPAAARNHGARLATGEWLAFLDADDAWLPRRLETQLAFAGRQPDVLLWCGKTTGMGTTDGGQQTADHRPQTTDQCRELALEAFALQNPVATTTVLLRRAAFGQAGGFDERFRGPEDYDLWMRVAALGRVVEILEPLARYREEPGSLSLDERRFLPEVLRVLDKAFGPSGVLHGHGSPARARAYQYFSASWMAYRRGDVARARRLWWRSLTTWPWGFPTATKPAWVRLRLLYRYLCVAPTSP